MLPYDGITRTGSKGVSHFAKGEDPHAGCKVLESSLQSKLAGSVERSYTAAAILRISR